VLCAEDRGDTDAQLAVVGGEQKKNRFKVPVLAVDDMVMAQEIFLMKIDTQGYEVQVLEGARRTLDRTRFLIVEINDESELGKVQETLGGAWRGRRLTTCDFLFSKV